MSPRIVALLVWFVVSIVLSNVLYQLFFTDLLKRARIETDPKAKKQPRKLQGLTGFERVSTAPFWILAVFVTWIGWMVVDSWYLPIRGRGLVGYPVAWMRYYTNGKFPPSFEGEKVEYEGEGWERRRRMYEAHEGAN